MYSSDLWKSSEMFGWHSEIFGSVRVIFGSLWNCSGDLWKSSGVFGWSSEIFERFRVAFDNLRKVNSLISLAETNCPIFSQIGQFPRFYSKSLLKIVSFAAVFWDVTQRSPHPKKRLRRRLYWKLSKLNPKLHSFQKLKDNSCADSTGLTDCCIIMVTIPPIFLTLLVICPSVRTPKNYTSSKPALVKSPTLLL